MVTGSVSAHDISSESESGNGDRQRGSAVHCGCQISPHALPGLCPVNHWSPGHPVVRVRLSEITPVPFAAKRFGIGWALMHSSAPS